MAPPSPAQTISNDSKHTTGGYAHHDGADDVVNHVEETLDTGGPREWVAADERLRILGGASMYGAAAFTWMQDEMDGGGSAMSQLQASFCGRVEYSLPA